MRKTLPERRRLAAAGRKNVIGKPVLYKTTKEFLIQFGLKDMSELPSLKEFEEIRRMAFADTEPPAGETVPDTDLPATADDAAAELDAVENPTAEPVTQNQTPTEPAPTNREN